MYSGHLDFYGEKFDIPVFRSTTLSVWPMCVQILNVPTKMSAFLVFCLWVSGTGKRKPDFKNLLINLLNFFELESLRDSNLVVANVIATFKMIQKPPNLQQKLDSFVQQRET